MIAIGVLASIATSGLGLDTQETDESRVPVSDLDEVFRRSVRACAGPDLVHFTGESPATFELHVELERPPASVAIPVRLVIDGAASSYEVTGVLDESTVGLGLRLELPTEETATWEVCSPWTVVKLGPASGDRDRGNITWQLSVTTEISTAGFKLFPWEADRNIKLEVRP